MTFGLVQKSKSRPSRVSYSRSYRRRSRRKPAARQRTLPCSTVLLIPACSMKRKVFGSVLLSLLAALASAHPGGLDSKGGHTDRKTGSYHTHKTPPAAAPKEKQAEPETADSPKEKSHWLTSSSGIRHNSKCRYFQTSKGRLGTKDEGRACKTCGG